MEIIPKFVLTHYTVTTRIYCKKHSVKSAMLCIIDALHILLKLRRCIYICFIFNDRFLLLTLAYL